MVQKKIRVRFAPSPTGELHVGNARTALFNWLYAKKNGGDFILRIEDTDTARSQPEYEENIISALRWLKLDWSEGPDVGGSVGPYRQSLRGKLYRRYAQSLIKSKNAYYCYCLPEELEIRRRENRQEGTGGYDNRCRELSLEQIKEFQDQGRKPCVRFRVPDKQIVFEDVIRGEVSFDTSLIPDFVIMRPDGRPSFNFAVVLDDSLMEITDVIRGEDHISNTPRHILLFEALGFPVPRFAHMSLTLGPDRKLFSKRHGAISIKTFENRGYLPEGIANYLALLGWAPPEGKEIMSAQEMRTVFDLESLSSSPAIFDWTKLNWVSGQHIRRADLSRLTDLAIPFLRAGGYLEEKITESGYNRVREIVEVLRESLNCLSEINDYAPIFFKEDLPEDPEGEAEQVLKKESVRKLIGLIKRNLEGPPLPPAEFWKKTVEEAREELGLKGKELFLPLRVIITGRSSGPELTAVLPLIPMDTIRRRVEESGGRIPKSE